MELPEWPVGDKRLAERHVEMDWTLRRRVADGHRPRHHGAQVHERHGGALRRHETRFGACETPKEATLGRRLRCPKPVELPGPVGGEDHQRNVRCPRLHHRGEEVCTGRSRRHQDRDGPACLQSEPERKKAGGALVNDAVDTQGRCRLGTGERERRASRARGDDRVAHAATHQLLHHRARPERV